MVERYAFHFQPFHCSPCSPAALRNVEAKSLETRQYPSVVASELHIWSEIFGSPTGKKVKPNMAGMEALSYVGFSLPVQFLRDT